MPIVTKQARFLSFLLHLSGVLFQKFAATFLSMRVTVIGTGYVGSVTGACLAYLGHRVSCVDTDAEKIAKLQRGQMPIYEPHLTELLAEAATRGGIEFTTE